jgi:hypothetical protein
MQGILSVEVGGSGTEYLLGYFDQPGRVSASSSPPAAVAGLHTCFVAPGLVSGGRVQGAHQLSWLDADGWAELGFQGQPEISMNDAEASALGEWSLRDGRDADLIYVGLGTGVGSARVMAGRLTPFELGHRPGYGLRICRGCDNTCVNGQIGGEVLPDPLTAEALALVVGILSAVLRDSYIGSDTVTVIGGGMARAYPTIVSAVQSETGFAIKSTRAGELKSAASVAMFERIIDS